MKITKDNCRQIICHHLDHRDLWWEEFLNSLGDALFDQCIVCQQYFSEPEDIDEETCRCLECLKTPDQPAND